MQLANASVVLLAGIGVNGMIAIAPNYVSNTYYTGLILVLFFGYTFSKLRFIWATITGWMIVVAYEITAVFLSDTSISLMINNNFFFLTGNLLGMFACYSIEFYLRKEFIHSRLLENEKAKVNEANLELEKRVAERTTRLVIMNKNLQKEILERKRGANPKEGSSITKAAVIVKKIKDLPPLPSIVSKALSMLSDPEIDLAAVEAVIGQDQVLVAKLIKVSNSALYGRFKKVITLKQAMTRLGSTTVKSLILSTSTRNYFFKRHRGLGTWGQTLWQHSVECGLASRRIAAAQAVQDPEEAFIGGIIHDIGKLVTLLVYPEKYKSIQEIVDSGETVDIQAEIDMLGCCHEEIGYLLLDQWEMPDSVKACAHYHHFFEAAGDYKNLAAIINYGNHFSHTFGAHPQMTYVALGESIPESALALNITEEIQAELKKAILKDYASADLIG